MPINIELLFELGNIPVALGKSYHGKSFYNFVRKLILHRSMPANDSQNVILTRFVSFSQPKLSVKNCKKRLPLPVTDFTICKFEESLYNIFTKISLQSRSRTRCRKLPIIRMERMDTLYKKLRQRAQSP